MITAVNRIALLGCYFLIYAAAGQPLQAQLVIKLAPQTVTAFEHYAATVESSLNQQWQGKKNFLYIEDDAAANKSVQAGELLVKQMTNGPVDVKDGLIHDWLGAVYIPNTTMRRVLNILQDFDDHKNIPK